LRGGGQAGRQGPNRHAAHDLGAALAQMAVQAAANGIGCTRWAASTAEAARAALAVPAGVEPFTAVALGWPGDPALLDADRRARESAPRRACRFPKPRRAAGGARAP
jgi:hypothetical protein